MFIKAPDTLEGIGSFVVYGAIMAAMKKLRIGTQMRLALQALKQWTGKRWMWSLGFSALFLVLMGTSTVLVPNQFFSREIAPVWWNYPVWLLTSVAAGMLAATYVREPAGEVARESQRTARLGMAGGFLAWFAVGCPVCNKIALLALGYTGALTWFAPFQPVLAVLALVLTLGALVVRLRGQVSCLMPRAEVAAA